MGSTTPCVNPAVITVEQEVGNPYDRHKMSRTEALFQLCFSRERTLKPLKKDKNKAVSLQMFTVYCSLLQCSIKKT